MSRKHADVSGPGSNKMLVRFFLSLDPEKQELFMKEVFCNNASDDIGTFMSYLEDPSKTVWKDLAIGAITRIMVDRLPYTEEQTFIKKGYNLYQWIHVKILDFQILNGDAIVSVVEEPDIKPFKLSMYYVEKLVLLYE